MKNTCFWRRQLEGTRAVEVKDWVNDNETCAQYFFAPNGKPNCMKICENVHVYSYKTPIKKAQSNFLQATRKPGRILIIFVTVLIFFFGFYTSSASVEFYKLTTDYWQNDFISDKTVEAWMFQVPCSNEGLIFYSNLFTDNQWQEAVVENCIKHDKKRG